MQIPNKHGSIESMPLKLVIISVITSITIPALWSAYNSYSNIQLENNLKFEIHKITSAINQVYLGANGTSLKLEINLRNIEHLKLGDSLGGEYSTVIRYKLKGSSEQVIPVSEDVQIASGENTALILYSGSYTLLFTHINYDINGDNKIGINERYVEAKIIM